MIYAIMAMTTDGGIGINNGLPWPHNKFDMEFFRLSTKNNVVLMGRHTYESLGSTHLPTRTNYVLSSRGDCCDESIRVAGDVPTVLKTLQEKHPTKDIYVMGGAQLYQQAWDSVDAFLITFFKGNYVSDTKIDVDMVNSLRLDSTLHTDDKIQIMRFKHEDVS